MADFNPALPIQLKWSVNENRFDDNGKNPLALSIFIPAESAFALAQLIMDSAEDSAKTKTAKVWDYTKNEEVDVQGFYINGKGRPGRDGDRTSYGSINPAKPANSSSNLKAEDIF
ncbi:hypothetical protein [Synechococcus sp. UW140]|uniref:hypothetical protein n=1 Tax=Synechococcus sp. UW140 TaxID=368503 RepID=UPI0025DCA6AD|nr:hypothetical protein [Synechococcus sp. UW140]